MNTPLPPGALAVPARSDEILRYLTALEPWLTTRREELDSLDHAINTSGRQDELIADMKLARTLWQSIQTRYAEITRAYDGGRVGSRELQELATLLWGNLDAMAVSIYEAGKLNDAVVGGLRIKLNTDPGLEQQLARLRELRVNLERIRDQIALEPPSLRPKAQAQYNDFTARLNMAEEKRSRGGDIGGTLAALEHESAGFERDLIVGASKRRDALNLLEQVRSMTADVTTKATATASYLAQMREKIWPLPLHSVPTVTDLGLLPNTAAELTRYQQKLAELNHTLFTIHRSLTNLATQYDQYLAEIAETNARASQLDCADAEAVQLFQALLTSLCTHKPVSLPSIAGVISAYKQLLESLSECK